MGYRFIAVGEHFVLFLLFGLLTVLDEVLRTFVLARTVQTVRWCPAWLRTLFFFLGRGCFRRRQIVRMITATKTTSDSFCFWLLPLLRTIVYKLEGIRHGNCMLYKFHEILAAVIACELEIRFQPVME